MHTHQTDIKAIAHDTMLKKKKKLVRFAVASSLYSSVKKLIDSICIGLMTD